jgi:hypothetical protein
VGREFRDRDDGGDLTNAQCKPIWNCHNESPPVQQTYPNKKINGKEKDPLEGLEGKLPKEEHKF